MAAKCDKIITAARTLVELLTPEERAAAGLPLLTLVRAVEDAHLREDEETWTVREQDIAAPETIEAWSVFAARKGTCDAKIQEARRTGQRWREWQQADLLRVKVPD